MLCYITIFLCFLHWRMLTAVYVGNSAWLCRLQLFQVIHGFFSVLTQAVAFLPKTVCNIKEVEFARAVKLNKTSIDLIMFQVPRVKASIRYYNMASSVSRQDKPSPTLWLATGVGDRVLPWYFACTLHTVSHKKNVFFTQIYKLYI